jgi:hypothetical protein
MESNNLTTEPLSGPLYHIDIGGVRHVAAGKLAAESGYGRDYIARLARQHRIAGYQLGRQWYIHEKSFRDFLDAQKVLREQRRLRLIAERRYERGSVRTAPETSHGQQ